MTKLDKALKGFVRKDLLWEIGFGLYIRTRANRIMGELMSVNSAGNDGVFTEAMERLCVDYQLGNLSLKDLSGESTPNTASVTVTPKS